MFTILLLLSALDSSLSSPIIAAGTIGEPIPLTICGYRLPRAMDVARHRTIQDIIWSCIATIFACTWVAVHPNPPGPGDSGWDRFKRRVNTMVYAMIAPEFMTLWAMVQWISARRIMREFNETNVGYVPWFELVLRFPKDCWMGIRDAVKEWFEDPRKRSNSEWTLTHGFFIQMGGFILYDEETPLRVLTFTDLKKLLDKEEVIRPTISEYEINDKSKGDFLTKLVVVLQTTWFVFQCLARWISHLPVTELEVVTLAFASLNVVTYGLWWKKPQNVLVAVRVQLRKSNSSDELGEDAASGQSSSRPTISLLGGNDSKERWITLKIRKEIGNGWAGWLAGIPLRFIQALLRPIGKMWGGYSDYPMELKSLRVPMFYAEGYDRSEVFPFLAISFLFGGLHLIPWPTQFPSTTELWLWRLSALIITATPLIIFSAGYLGNYIENHDNWFIDILFSILSGLCFSSVPLYVLARLILLVLAFTTLRALPDGWDIAIEWTTFLPHI